MCDRWRAEKAALKRIDRHWTKAEIRTRKIDHQRWCTTCGTAHPIPTGLARQPDER